MDPEAIIVPSIVHGAEPDKGGLHREGLPLRRTTFQQQIKDFKPKVISSDGRGVILWKTEGRQRVALHCPRD